MTHSIVRQRTTKTRLERLHKMIACRVSILRRLKKEDEWEVLQESAGDKIAEINLGACMETRRRKELYHAHAQAAGAYAAEPEDRGRFADSRFQVLSELTRCVSSARDPGACFTKITKDGSAKTRSLQRADSACRWNPATKILLFSQFTSMNRDPDRARLQEETHSSYLVLQGKGSTKKAQRATKMVETVQPG